MEGYPEGPEGAVVVIVGVAESAGEVFFGKDIIEATQCQGKDGIPFFESVLCFFRMIEVWKSRGAATEVYAVGWVIDVVFYKEVIATMTILA